jgi:hypothetical protein
MAAKVGLAPDLSVGYEQARAFLDPILAGVLPDDDRWNVSRRMW